MTFLSTIRLARNLTLHAIQVRRSFRETQVAFTLGQNTPRKMVVFSIKKYFLFIK